MSNKNYLMLCELFHPKMHGFDENSDPTVLGHYMIIFIKDNNETSSGSEDNNDDDYSDYESYDEFDDSDEENDELLVDNLTIQTHQNKYRYIVENSANLNINLEHQIIRNYINIVTKDNYITPQIGQRIYLSGDECVAIIKTMWLKIVQRCWKRVYKKRMQMLNEIKRNPNILFKRAIEPPIWHRIPTIHGMFWN